MRRRNFIAGLGAAAAWPLTARAQGAGNLRVVGYLGLTTSAAASAQTSAFVERLRDLGWVEGRNIVIEYRQAQARAELAGEFFMGFVLRKVDVIVTSGNEYALLAKRATSVTPIVFIGAGDPIGTGLVESMARPGGNVTGFSTQLTETAAKRVDLLHKILPGLRRLAVMAAVVPESVLEVDAIRMAAKTLGIEVKIYEIRKTEDISLAFDGMKGQADALYVANSAPLIVNQTRILTLALTARLPTVFSSKAWPVGGGLMSYGVNFVDLNRRSAELVDKILRGTRPADIPVEQASKFELVVNLVTAKALGLTITETFLLLADEVIE
jgi:putative tryptophan/tyrosine transport system substrate-binding protein